MLCVSLNQPWVLSGPFVKLNKKTQRALLKCWSLSLAERQCFRRARAEAKDGSAESLSKLTGHSMTRVAHEQDAEKAIRTCAKCVRQWRAWSQAKRQGLAMPCKQAAQAKKAALREKRRWWVRTHPDVRQNHVNLAAHTAGKDTPGNCAGMWVTPSTDGGGT